MKSECALMVLPLLFRQLAKLPCSVGVADRDGVVYRRADDARQPRAREGCNRRGPEYDAAGIGGALVLRLHLPHLREHVLHRRGRDHEDGVMLGVRVVAPPLRRAVQRFGQIARGKHAHRHQKTEMPRDQRADALLQRFRWFGFARKQHVAALYVRRNVRKAFLRKPRLELRHRQHVVAAHVDAAQQCDVLSHIDCPHAFHYF